MPRNKPVLKVVDDGNEESGRKSRGPAINRVTLIGRLAMMGALVALGSVWKAFSLNGRNVQARLVGREG